jgi:hypothetical protein
MSVRWTQREVDSAEFGEWLAFWQLEAEGETKEPTDEEFAAKMEAFRLAANASLKG